MRGGKGNDIFEFSSIEDSINYNPDIILDFVHGEDLIDLSELGVDGIDDITITENRFEVNDSNFSFIVNIQLDEADSLFA